MKKVLLLSTISLFLPSSIFAESTASKVIDIKIPEVPKVTTAIPKVEVHYNNPHGNISTDRSIKFSKRVPPNYISSAERYGKGGEGASLSYPKSMVGDVDKGRISAYLRADLIDANKAKEKLKNAGFEILSTTALDDSGELISIVFTNDTLKKMASNKGKGYMGTLRLLIDPKNKQISITNPLYLAKAFLQDEFNKEMAKKVLTALVNEFKSAKNSLDKLKFQRLPSYNFMKGMPHFGDQMVVASGKDLKSKVVNNKNVAFVLELSNGSTLIGVKLGKKANVFPQRIGTNNAAMLPYPVLIEDGEAKILDPKYYLALMYPDLKIEGFMTIAMIPRAIKNDCKNIFK